MCQPSWLPQLIWICLSKKILRTMKWVIPPTLTHFWETCITFFKNEKETTKAITRYRNGHHCDDKFFIGPEKSREKPIIHLSAKRFLKKISSALRKRIFRPFYKSFDNSTNVDKNLKLRNSTPSSILLTLLINLIIKCNIGEHNNQKINLIQSV